MIDTWTCHVCGKERPDAYISVASGFIKELPGAQINIRYCNDNPECDRVAHESAAKGDFPKRPEKKKTKKWWEFWK